MNKIFENLNQALDAMKAETARTSSLVSAQAHLEAAIERLKGHVLETTPEVKPAPAAPAAKAK